MSSFFVVPFLLLISSLQFAQSCDDCGCFESCFNNPGNYPTEYMHLRNIVDSLRSAKQVYGVHGTAYLLDGTADNTWQWAYQRELAALVSLTHTPDDRCNPFFMARYHSGWAASRSPLQWQCLDKCQAYRTIKSGFQFPYADQTTVNWLHLGCFLTQRWATFSGAPFTSATCRKNYDAANDMVIAFMNNDNQVSGPWCTNYDVRAAIRIDSNTTPGEFATDAEIDIKTFSALSNYYAARQLNSCIARCCCSGRNIANPSSDGVNLLVYQDKVRTLSDDEYEAEFARLLELEAKVNGTSQSSGGTSSIKNGK